MVSNRTWVILGLAIVLVVLLIYGFAGSGSDSSTGGLFALKGRCTDTCVKLGYNCGTQIICKKSVGCGTCQTGYTCSSGKCTCVPNCAGKTCGDNGCGGNCGTCNVGYTCTNGNCAVADSCTDSDGGYILNVKGTVNGYKSGNAYSSTDSCSNKTLTEYYCAGTSMVSAPTACSNNTYTSCSDGKCI